MLRRVRWATGSRSAPSVALAFRRRRTHSARIWHGRILAAKTTPAVHHANSPYHMSRIRYPQ